MHVPRIPPRGARHRLVRFLARVGLAVLFAGAVTSRLAAQDRSLLPDLIRAQQHRSWISPGRVLKWWHHGFNLQPSNVDSLLFEADIAPNFTAWGQELGNVPILGAVKAVVVTPRVNLRMRTAFSEPVRSPSYNPYVTVYTSLPFRRDSTDFMVWRLAHHSNGQEGEALLPDGTPNLVDGSFSTNYVLLGPSLSRIRPGNYVFVRPTVEWHFGQDSLAKEYYGQWRLNLRVMRLTNRSHALMGLYEKAHFVLQGDVGWWVDRDWLPFEKRLDVTLSASLLSPFGGTMGPIVQFYAGRDYYNLRYRSEQIWILRFGFTTSGGEYTIR